MSPEAAEYLRQVGIDPINLGAAKIRSLRVAAKRRVVESGLPFTALSLSRFALDEAMVAEAERCGCVVRRGVLVEQLTASGDLWLSQLRGEPPLSARTVFLASGKHDLHGWPITSGVQTDMVAFKLHWQLDPGETEALRDFMDLFLFEGGCCGLSLVERDVANLCLVVRQSRLRTAGNWSSLFVSILEENPLLLRHLQGATALWPRPLALSSIPYGFLASRSAGLWRLGDQTTVIPSFTGDGMSIALHSGALAAEMYLAGDSPDLFARTPHSQLRRGMSLATLIAQLIVSGAGRALTPRVLSLFPGVIGLIASSTRIPQMSRVSVPAPEPISCPVPSESSIQWAPKRPE